MVRVRTIFSISLVALSLVHAGDALGQCILANPSFEVPGSGGSVFAGWGQVGVVGWSTEATHGHRAARVSGPDPVAGGVSGCWQLLETAPGKKWMASARVWHSASKPLTGESKGFLYIEWRDSGGGLIGSETHIAVDATRPPGHPTSFSIESEPAPAGAVATILMVGVLEAPGDPVADVLFDEVRFETTGPPSLEEVQWNDFPGGRTLSFAGRTWRVKGPGYYGPGPSLFCDSPSCVWVDVDGRMHLTIQQIGASWYSSEVTLVDLLGYGDYVFTTVGRLDALDPRAVFGLFIWQYGPCWDPANGWWNPYNEIDVEFSRWGNPSNDVGQFVVQPFDAPGNISRFAAAFAEGERTSHAFRWLPDRVEFRSWRGGPLDEAPQNMIHAWTYTGRHIPRPELPRVHLNLWQVGGPPGARQEVVLDGFEFVPTTVVGVPAAAPSPGALARIERLGPNPFGARAGIRFALATGERVELGIFDLAGRRVRTLVRGFVPAGSHEAEWNGRDDAGVRVAPGVYLCRLRAGESTHTKRLVRVE